MGERKEDSFLVLKVYGKIVQYNVVLKTVCKIGAFCGPHEKLFSWKTCIVATFLVCDSVSGKIFISNIVLLLTLIMYSIVIDDIICKLLYISMLNTTKI